MPRPRNSYDHRLKQLVRERNDVSIATSLGVPRPTAAGWLRHPARARCVALPVPGLAPLRPACQRAVPALQAPVELASCASLREQCPRRAPRRLTVDELMAMKHRATSEELRHMPLCALALHAQRIGKVFASASTWARTIRERGWRRPRRRLHPLRPTEGARASRPNELFHLDVTILKLLDGTRLYLHAVIDNFSRRILAWHLAVRLEPASTCQVLCQAAACLPAPAQVELYADAGVENVNAEVDKMLGDLGGALRRVLAQVEVCFSNSLIESWWRSLKHNWLYLNTLDSFAAVERLVAFYVQEHNSVMPHSAFQGQTPGELYFGTGDDVPTRLAQARREARARRLEYIRALRCSACAVTPTDNAAESDVTSPAISGMSDHRTDLAAAA